MNKGKISNAVISRLPRYYRFLGRLLRDNVTRISSKELAELMQVTASQIRQDLNCFGGFGQQGYGYNVELLHHEIGEILGLGNKTPVILIGAGNLGKVVANQLDLQTRGFQLVAAFDRSPSTIGQPLIGLTIRDIAELEQVCAQLSPKAAIICVPTAAAAELADKLVGLGIVGFWNFSSYDFTYHHEQVKVVNVHLSDSIMTLSYLVSHLDDAEEK
ncbi:MAG: redox-sensing transcriptional repressor Rex [Angelakisella sp.]